MTDKEQLKDIKKRLDKTFGDEDLELLADLLRQSEENSGAIKKLAEVIKENNLNLQDVLLVFKSMIQTVKDLNNKVAKDIDSSIKKNFNFPEEFRISNLPKQEKFPDKIEIKNMPMPKAFPDKITISNLDEIVVPEEIKLKKPEWLEQVTKKELVDMLSVFLKNIVKAELKVDLDTYRDARKPVAVRLSNGRSFYEAIAQVVSGGGGAAFPFKTSLGRAKEALVDNDGHQQIDIISMPPVSVDVGDVEIGAIEIKDHDTDTRANVGDNGLHVDVQASVLPSGASTLAKQDSQITLQTALNALITTLNSTVTTNDKTHLLLQQIRDSIAMRPDYNEATNTQSVAGAVTVTGTITTVTTLTGQTNIGGFPADMMTENSSFQDWGLSIRSLLI